MAQPPKTRIVYSLYPRSFQASGDGAEGDLAGAMRRLPHIARLGVDTVWIGPFYPSEMIDGGYDITDHTGVDPRFGSPADARAFIAEAHGLGLSVLVDLVLNHTSQRHPWFLGASARDGVHDDWYVFADPEPDGSPPNNWTAQFGHTAWRWVSERRQYVLAQFLDCQPCLDLRNPTVLDALRAIVEHWRGEGVDGFRIDAVSSYLYDPSLADNPPADEETKARAGQPEHNPYAWQDHVYDMLPGDGASMGAMLRDWAGRDAFLIGEINTGNQSVEIARAFAEPGRLDAGYTVDLLSRPYTPALFAELLERLDGGPILWMMSSHDHPRALSRAGDGSARDARLFATLLACLPGHIGLYQGEELGLPQVDLPYEALVDPMDRKFHPLVMGRDGARVPIPWEANAPNVGFSRGTPWLPIPEDWSVRAVDRAETDPGSVLAHYRRVLGLRREHPALHDGRTFVERADDDVLMLRREVEGETLRLVCNFARHPVAAEGGGVVLACSEQIVEAAIIPARSAVLWRLASS